MPSQRSAATRKLLQANNIIIYILGRKTTMMLQPSYTDLMEVVNQRKIGQDDTEESSENAVVNSRYSIVMATAKRARQIVAGDIPLVSSVTKDGKSKKPLSMAVEELYGSKIRILGSEE